MENTEIITGNKLYGFLKQLQKDRILLRMHVLGTYHEGITVLMGFQNSSDGKKCLMIDYPGNTDLVFPLAVGKKCLFRFNDRNSIQYVFRTIIKQINDDHLLMEFPEDIERLQRREYFRIPVPLSTKIKLNKNNSAYEFDVINLSEGGALLSQKSRLHNETFFFQGALLKNLRLLSQEDNSAVMFHIESAEIVRTYLNRDTGRQHYALKFAYISKPEAEILRKFIYNYQREVLKTRIYPED